MARATGQHEDQSGKWRKVFLEVTVVRRDEPNAVGQWEAEILAQVHFDGHQPATGAPLIPLINHAEQPVPAGLTTETNEQGLWSYPVELPPSGGPFIIGAKIRDTAILASERVSIPAPKREDRRLAAGERAVKLTKQKVEAVRARKELREEQEKAALQRKIEIIDTCVGGDSVTVSLRRVGRNGRLEKGEIAFRDVEERYALTTLPFRPELKVLSHSLPRLDRGRSIRFFLPDDPTVEARVMIPAKPLKRKPAKAEVVVRRREDSQGWKDMKAFLATIKRPEPLGPPAPPWSWRMMTKFKRWWRDPTAERMSDYLRRRV